MAYYIIPAKLRRQYKRQRRLEYKLEVCKVKTRYMETELLPKPIPTPTMPKREQKS